MGGDQPAEVEDYPRFNQMRSAAVTITTTPTVMAHSIHGSIDTSYSQARIDAFGWRPTGSAAIRFIPVDEGL